MQPTLYNVLSIRNAHPRDTRIQFFEEEHKYIVDANPNIKYTSVTTWVHEQFEKFDADKIIEKMMKGSGWKPGHKYWGMTVDQIKEQWDTNKNSVSTAGTDLHYEIECFNNDKRFQFDYTNKELFDIYLADNGLKYCFTNPLSGSIL